MASCCVNSSCMFMDEDVISHAVVMNRPTSPIRL